MTNFEKITPETYEKMNEEFEEEGPSESLSPPKNKLMNGGNVIDDNFKDSLLGAQLDNICKDFGW